MRMDFFHDFFQKGTCQAFAWKRAAGRLGFSTLQSSPKRHLSKPQICTSCAWLFWRKKKKKNIHPPQVPPPRSFPLLKAFKDCCNIWLMMPKAARIHSAWGVQEPVFFDGFFKVIIGKHRENHDFYEVFLGKPWENHGFPVFTPLKCDFDDLGEHVFSLFGIYASFATGIPCSGCKGSRYARVYHAGEMFEISQKKKNMFEISWDFTEKIDF